MTSPTSEEERSPMTHDRPTEQVELPSTPDTEAKAMSYDHAHEIAIEMGYPSLTEALEHLDELRARTPSPDAPVTDDPDALTGCADDQIWAGVPVQAMRDAMALPTDDVEKLVERVARADHTRAVYARALVKMRDMLTAVHDELEDEGDRVYLGSTNHAELIHEAWHLADALKWDEILDDTQPETPLAETNLRLQAELAEARAAIVALAGER